MSECKKWPKITLLTQALFYPYPNFTILHSSLLTNGSDSHKVKQIYLNLYPPYLLKGVPNSAKKGLPNNAKSAKHTV